MPTSRSKWSLRMATTSSACSLLRESREAAQVGEEHRHLALLAGEDGLLTAGRDVADDLTGGVAGERAEARRDAPHGVFELGNLAEHRLGSGRLLQLEPCDAVERTRRAAQRPRDGRRQADASADGKHRPHQHDRDGGPAVGVDGTHEVAIGQRRGDDPRRAGFAGYGSRDDVPLLSVDQDLRATNSRIGHGAACPASPAGHGEGGGFATQSPGPPQAALRPGRT